MLPFPFRRSRTHTGRGQLTNTQVTPELTSRPLHAARFPQSAILRDALTTSCILQRCSISARYGRKKSDAPPNTAGRTEQNFQAPPRRTQKAQNPRGPLHHCSGQSPSIPSFCEVCRHISHRSSARLPASLDRAAAKLEGWAVRRSISARPIHTGRSGYLWNRFRHRYACFGSSVCNESCPQRAT